MVSTPKPGKDPGNRKMTGPSLLPVVSKRQLCYTYDDDDDGNDNNNDNNNNDDDNNNNNNNNNFISIALSLEQYK